MAKTMTAPPASRPVTLGAIRSRVTARASTTPGRLRVASLAILAGFILLWVIAATTLTARQRAANAVGLETEPLLVGAEGIYGSLADADATAANSFLSGGVEQPERRARYDADLKTATDDLATVSRQVGSSTAAQQAVKAVTEQLPIYTGLVEAARANNRQHLPVGAAYLGQASTLMRAQILPAADRLYKVEAGRLNNSYHSGTSPIGLIALILVGLAVLAGLVYTQIFLAGRTNRIVNIPLLGGTVLVLGLTVWIITGFALEQHRLNRARSHGSNAVQVLAQARVLALRAQADENLSLVARGSSTQYDDDFKLAANALGGSDGSTGRLALAATLPEAPRAADAIRAARSSYADYIALHDQITKSKYEDAVKIATDSAVAKFTAFDGDLNTAIAANQQQFESAAKSARHVLGAASLAIPFFIVVAGLLCLLGLQQRINEYR
jgi:hypothetical protein